jgi:hypothetical protein
MFGSCHALAKEGFFIKRIEDAMPERQHRQLLVCPWCTTATSRD